MDDMIQLEDFCVFCSKYLAGMHDFNKKMHFNTCKLRKLFDSVYKNSDSGDDIDQIFMDDNCSFCLKSLKDFKSDYNKRIHIKCCKIKKETFDRRDSILQLQQCEELSHSAASSTQCNESQTLYQSLTEACIFCNKPLSNLNSFNRKMHIEHCKIRKSLEGTVRSRGKNKSENLSKQDGANIGDHCVYCDKSFARLSDFNRRLHSEHCKSKKRKLKTLNNVISSSLNLSSLQSTESGYVSNLDQVQNSLILLANNSCANISLSTSNSLDISSISDQSSIQTNSLSQSPVCMDSNQLCEYCSRSLANLSNFNKNIHIEQCKLKQSKKTNNSQEKYSTKPPRKRVKSDKNKINQSEFCTSQIMTHLDLRTSSDIASSSNSNSDRNMSSISSSANSNSSNTELSHQFNQSNQTTIISLDNTTIHQLGLAASQHSQNLINGGTHTLQITLDPNTNQIYI